MAIEDFYYSGFTIRVNTSGVDSGGSETESWADGSTFDGTIRELNGTEIIANDKKEIKSTHRLYCSCGELITVKNRIRFERKEYHVINVYNPHNLDEFQQIDLLYTISTPIWITESGDYVTTESGSDIIFQ